MDFYSKEIQIMRQSQSKLVLEYMNTVGVKLSFEELQRATDLFVECCLRPLDNDLKERIRKFDKWVLDKKISE